MKYIVLFLVALLSAQVASADCRVLDGCPNTYVWVKDGHCKKADGSLVPKSYYELRDNHGDGRPVLLTNQGNCPTSGCGHNPGAHNVDSNGFPIGTPIKPEKEVVSCQ